jgi:flagellar protein FlaG
LSKNLVSPSKPEPAKPQKTAQHEEKQGHAEAKQSKEVSEDLLRELTEDLEVIHNVRLQFSRHEATGRTMVKIVDKNTDKLIREIPSKEVLNLAAKLDEMIGIIFDKTV